ncbi:BrnT family toxin [Trinickia dabaoshanensis]|uniref:BrnT family toxin n=1 Tax=Trinickia dabaoshanensis TaxID=564714 RepID=A0A2N7VSN9_9BURK|nr:BrnT family toxin [Trinickia dabaoshanensis]
MNISYDPKKSRANVDTRGLSFESAREFEMAEALIVEDMRKVYSERRFQALGYIGHRLHMLVFTPRDGNVHVISLRKANAREVTRYEQTKSE